MIEADFLFWNWLLLVSQRLGFRLDSISDAAIVSLLFYIYINIYNFVSCRPRHRHRSPLAMID